jgi:hypothetical protein
LLKKIIKNYFGYFLTDSIEKGSWLRDPRSWAQDTHILYIQCCPNLMTWLRKIHVYFII